MPQELASVTSPQIASYYDRNTPRFLRHGGSTAAGAIHRQIWAPGVTSKDQALAYINRLVTAEIEPILHAATGDARVLDLGCGVGGTATWLAQALDVDVIGVTNSAVQQQLAARRSAELGLGHRCRFLQADFSDFDTPGNVAAVVMIEALTHASDTASLLSAIWEMLLPGGSLIIADDFIAPGVSPANHWLWQFQRGWHLNSLLSAAEFQTLAAQAGFRQVKDIDLTSFIRVLPRLILGPASLVSRLPFSQVYWQNLKGGIALQVCIRSDLTRYQNIVLGKPSG